MSTSLYIEWQNRAAAQKKVHKKWLKKAKPISNKKLDEEAQKKHEEVFEEIDCLDCAQCCTHIPPLITPADAGRIAKQLGMKRKEFEASYLRLDEDGDWVMRSTPCPFLQEDNTCFIYSFRPKACRQYPHTDDYQFSQHLNYHAPNAQHCPAAFHILERLIKHYS